MEFEAGEFIQHIDGAPHLYYITEADRGSYELREVATGYLYHLDSIMEKQFQTVMVSRCLRLWYKHQYKA